MTDVQQSEKVLVVGHGDLARSTSAALERRGAVVTWLREPNDRRLRASLSQGWRSVMIVSHDDVRALRLALLTEHLRPGLPLIVTIFDRTVAKQLVQRTENCTVLSLADAVVPSLAGPCIDPRLAAVVNDRGRPEGIRMVAGHFQPTAVPGVSRARRLAARAESQLRPLDSSSRLLVVGALGLAGLLVVDTIVATVLLGEGLLDAMYATMKTVATVGPNTVADEGPAWYKLFSFLSILLASLLFVAFTAGLINRLLDRRLEGIVGARTIPRRDHVVVTGLGQVGLRLCTHLKDAGIPVIAVERDPNAPHVWLARSLGIPVVIGRGADRFLLERLQLSRARSLAAVTSDDDENVAICVAAREICAQVNLVLRAGDGEVSAETRALFSVGVVCDVLRLGGARLAATALGRPGLVMMDSDRLRLLEQGEETILRHEPVEVLEHP